MNFSIFINNYCVTLCGFFKSNLFMCVLYFKEAGIGCLNRFWAALAGTAHTQLFSGTPAARAVPVHSELLEDTQTAAVFTLYPANARLLHFGMLFFA